MSFLLFSQRGSRFGALMKEKNQKKEEGGEGGREEKGRV
jgi:hypothetical protein